MYEYGYAIQAETMPIIVVYQMLMLVLHVSDQTVQ